MSRNERVVLIMFVGLWVWLVMAANNVDTIRDIDYKRACVEADARDAKTAFLLSFGK